MTGAGLALPLLSAGGAHAADTATWDRVAQCESGGVWSAASGNGFYGGLQLTQEMWDDYGGGAYASRPDLASRAQQIAVAESILDDRGPDAWPSCAVNAGLTRDGRAPEVDPGSTSTPMPDPSEDEGGSDSWEPSPSTGSSDTPDDPDASGSDEADRGRSHEGSHRGSPDGSDEREPGGPADEAPGDATGEPSPDSSSPSAPDEGDSSTAPEPSDSATPGDQDGDQDGDSSHSADPSDGGDSADPGGTAGETPRETPGKGRHRGDADPGEGGGGDRSSGGRHASRGDGDRKVPADGGDYTVRPGDSLSAIAAAHRLPGGWPALYERNEGVIGADENLIHPGQRLDLGHKES
ncbi:transglycosylase family protein [Streptomyces sp. NPDC002446]